MPKQPSIPRQVRVGVCSNQCASVDAVTLAHIMPTRPGRGVFYAINNFRNRRIDKVFFSDGLSRIIRRGRSDCLLLDLIFAWIKRFVCKRIFYEQ